MGKGHRRPKTEGSSGRRRATLGAIVLAAVAWAWLLLDRPGKVADPSEGKAVTAARAAQGHDGPAQHAHDPDQVALTTTASDGLPIMPAHPDAPVPEGPVHPHPITPERVRIYRENNLVAALNLAVDREDAAALRSLVAQYQAEFPEDKHVLQEGYALIAACLDGPDDATLARADDFWRTQIRSQTRRYVRRHCLERER